MTPGSTGPQLYAVSYAGRVKGKLLELADEARERGDGPAFLAALREFHRRLCLYPQFADPLLDLRREPGQVRLGLVWPLSMRYSVLEEARAVFVGALPVLLPKARQGRQGG